MFILTKIADLVEIKPEDFSKRSIDAIEDNINEKYANKVIQQIGLCISLYDLLWSSEGLIGHGTGLVNVNVEFRMIVFRPFKGEVITGKIRSSTPSGMHLSIGDFFGDIFVPLEELPEDAEYSHSDQLWVWNFDGNRLYYDNNEAVRFQVIDEEWHDQTPLGPTKSEETDRKAPYKIKGSMSGEGLGPCMWWDAEAEEGEEEMEDEAVVEEQ